ncbi:caspase-10-like isoform X2 [Ornithorhynchus anatinus]|uniref:Caspase 10 n=1 Tax=Ornithorhynchus anatinus TaxID=9258 RepID=F7FS79_ORNAN|nr:caspase-10-like isoform X2 [Ornithorhynchus anatinus]
MNDDRSLSFREQLLNIDKNLGSEEVEALKFLCSDWIPFKKLEKVRSAKEIFQHLEEGDRLDQEDHFVVVELLYHIRQHALLKHVGYTKEKVVKELPTKGKLSQFRQMLFELSEDITQEDLKNMLFLLTDHLPKKKMQSTLSLLLFLEKQELLGENNLEKLEEVCRQVSPELVKRINKYKNERLSRKERLLVDKEGVTTPEGQRISSSGPDSVCLLSSLQEPSGQKVRTNPDDDKVVKVPPPVSGEMVGVSNFRRGSEGIAEELSTYRMNRAHRGYCIIFNNYTFKGKLNSRKGTQKDVAELERVFRWLGLDVETFNDKTRQEMVATLEECSRRPDHDVRDCLVCCVLSHGESGAVYSADEELIPIRQIMSYFTAKDCPSLAHKPKLFFIQACQGKDIQEAVQIEPDARNPDLDPQPEPPPAPRESPKDSIPAEVDFLLGMATVDGYASFRHVNQGTWYIQALCRQLALLVPRREDILSILTAVNDDVSQRADHLGKKKQMPQPAFTLRRKLVFPVPPGAPPSSLE